VDHSWRTGEDKATGGLVMWKNQLSLRRNETALLRSGSRGAHFQVRVEKKTKSGIKTGNQSSSHTNLIGEWVIRFGGGGMYEQWGAVYNSKLEI